LIIASIVRGAPCHLPCRCCSRSARSWIAWCGYRSSHCHTRIPQSATSHEKHHTIEECERDKSYAPLHLQLSDVLKDHVDVVVEAEQGPTEFLVALHHDPYPGTNTFVNELCVKEKSSISRAIYIEVAAVSVMLVPVAGVNRGLESGSDTYRGAEVVTPWLLCWRGNGVSELIRVGNRVSTEL